MSEEILEEHDVSFAPPVVQCQCCFPVYLSLMFSPTTVGQESTIPFMSLNTGPLQVGFTLRDLRTVQLCIRQQSFLGPV